MISSGKVCSETKRRSRVEKELFVSRDADHVPVSVPSVRDARRRAVMVDDLALDHAVFMVKQPDILFRVVLILAGHRESPVFSPFSIRSVTRPALRFAPLGEPVAGLMGPYWAGQRGRSKRFFDDNHAYVHVV